jgi:hypothetical protein
MRYGMLEKTVEFISPTLNEVIEETKLDKDTILSVMLAAGAGFFVQVRQSGGNRAVLELVRVLKENLEILNPTKPMGQA